MQRDLREKNLPSFTLMWMILLFRCGIRGCVGSAFDLDNVLIEDCARSGLVVQGEETTCTNVEIRNNGWSAVVVSGASKVIMQGANTTGTHFCS